MQRDDVMAATSSMCVESLTLISSMLDDEDFSPDDVLQVLQFTQASLAVFQEHFVSVQLRPQKLGVGRSPWHRDMWPDLQFYTMFRVSKEHFTEILHVLKLDSVSFKTKQRCSFTGQEGLLVLLKRLAYADRWVNLTETFPCQPGHLCDLFMHVLDYIDENFATPLENVLPSIPLSRLRYYAQAIKEKTGTNNDRCIGFLDGTFRPHARPGEDQEVCYNGHYRGHGFKFLSAVSPDGLHSFYYGPVEGRRHDMYLLNCGGLDLHLDNLHARVGEQFHVYGDAAFSLTENIQTGFNRGYTTPSQQAYTAAMTKARVSVEWGFGGVCNTFKYLDYRPQLKVGASPIGKEYRVAILLRNFKTCLEGGQGCGFFQCFPPPLQEYVSWKIL